MITDHEKQCLVYAEHYASLIGRTSLDQLLQRVQVTTRAVQMDGVLVLAPLVDMCSHAEAEAAAAEVVANASSGIVLRALRDVASGDAVMSIP